MGDFYHYLNKLITFDKIRIFKLIEILEYTFIFLLLLVILEHILNKYYFSKYNLKKEMIDEEMINDEENNYTLIYLIKLFFIVVRDTFLIIIILYYLKKIALLFPSIPHLIDNKFKEHTTLEYSIHIALIVVFIEFLPEYKKKLEQLRIALLKFNS